MAALFRFKEKNMSEQNLKFCRPDTVGAAAVTQYMLVKTGGALVKTAADTDKPNGIVQDGAAIGATVNVCFFGHTKAIADDAIAQFAELMPSANGKVITHDGGADSPRIGVALQAADADGDLIEILLGVTLGAGTAA
jgi:hypothetical protein